MSTCDNNCSSCSENCASRKPSREELLEPLNQYSKVKRVIGVVSGKGGVGKSLVTSSLAVEFQRKGYKTAVLDADITGPSIPRAFGIKERAQANEMGILPAVTESGIQVMSVNLLLDTEETPVIWRGPVIAGTVKQFWSEVVWNDVDYMFVDMPPGTGDVPLTVFQSLPLDGIVIVTSPQDLVSMIVKKAVNMAGAMDIPILGVIENYSYIKCPDCGKPISVFGESKVDEIAVQYGIPVLARIPIDPKVASAVDAGQIETVQADWLEDAAGTLDFMLQDAPDRNANKTIKIALPLDDNGEVFQHFGHTKQFHIVEVNDSRIVKQYVLDAAGSGHESLAFLLKQNGVEILICGGIGAGAQDALGYAGISVIPGVQGKVDAVLIDFFTGNLTFSKEANCDHHDHHHEEGEECNCGNDGDCGCGNDGGCGCGGGCH